MILPTEASTTIDMQSIQKANNVVAAQTSRFDVRRLLCWFMIITFIMVSLAFNIYLGVEHFQTRGLNFEKTTQTLTQSCEITTYSIALESEAAGAILRSIPDCAKNITKNNTRLLASCSTWTRVGTCLYCILFNPYGRCTKYSNNDPTVILSNAASAWIRCFLDNTEVILYDVQGCTQVGLAEVAISLAVYGASAAIKCFPANTKVITESGIVDMSSLKIGDKVLSLVDSKPQFTKITTWLHFDQVSHSIQYIRITDEANATFVTSAYHNIAVQNLSYLFAKDLLEERLHGSEKGIKKIEIVEEKGIFAPLTDSGNYFILKSNDEKVLAHCLAHIKDPELYEGIVHTAVSVYDTFFEPSYAEIHPLGRWFESVYDLLLEK